MASKKYMLAALLIVLIQSVGLAQTDWGWDWKDTSKIAVKNLPQHNEFLNNQYPYPAIPRSQWELGFSLGNSRIIGDVANYKFGYGAGISLRKALNNMISLRGGFLYQQTTGIDAILSTNALTDGQLSANAPYRAITGYGAYQVYAPTQAANQLKAFVANYRNKSYSGFLDMIVSLNSLSHYRGNPKWDVYVFGGYALVASDVDTRLALNGATGAQFDFTSVNFRGTKSSVQDAVNNILKSGTGSNYTNAPVRGRTNEFGTKNILYNHSLSYGGGISYKLSPKVNIGIEDRVINTFSGDVDGLNTGKSDLINYLSARLNINIGNKSKRVEPLWWINPNNFVYSELNSPKHMKMPKVVLPDADGDGVTDQFDLEPNTPKGAAVDSHGVAKDTDGDGVPDFKDKEILTQKSCFPVNNDGVGTCPEPACCKELRDMIANWKPVEKVECAIGNLPSIQFKGNAKLSKDAQSVLASVAAKVNANPNCKVKVIGYGASSKAAQQLSWERVNAVIKYLVEKQGVSESRLLFVYAQDGDANTVDLQGTLEDGPNTVPAPHPNLRSKN
jgi:OOP family OmpA-OmpF porin